MSMLFFETLLVALKVWLVPGVYEVSKCCPGIFDVWSELSEALLTVIEYQTRGAQGRPTSVQGVPPSEILKNRSQQSAIGRKCQGHCSKMRPQMWDYVVFFAIMFNVFSASVLGWMFNGFSNGFGISFT